MWLVLARNYPNKTLGEGARFEFHITRENYLSIFSNLLHIYVHVTRLFRIPRNARRVRWRLKTAGSIRDILEELISIAPANEYSARDSSRIVTTRSRSNERAFRHDQLS